MKEFWNSIQFVFAAIGGWLGYFLGGCDGLLYALLLFVICDYITGVLCAVSDKKLSSEVGFRGICRKVLIFLLVGIGICNICFWHRIFLRLLQMIIVPRLVERTSDCRGRD